MLRNLADEVIREYAPIIVNLLLVKWNWTWPYEPARSRHSSPEEWVVKIDGIVIAYRRIKCREIID